MNTKRFNVLDFVLAMGGVAASSAATFFGNPAGYLLWIVAASLFSADSILLRRRLRAVTTQPAVPAPGPECLGCGQGALEGFVLVKGQHIVLGICDLEWARGKVLFLREVHPWGVVGVIEGHGTYEARWDEVSGLR